MGGIAKHIGVAQPVAVTGDDAVDVDPAIDVGHDAGDDQLNVTSTLDGVKGVATRRMS